MNVEDLLIKKSIEYIASGGDLVVRCLNPDHEDTNPSMRIDRIQGIFRCPSCGFKGNIFKYFEVSINYTDIKRLKLKEKIERIRASGIGLSLPIDTIFWDTDYRDIKATTYIHFKAFTSNEYLNRIMFPISDAWGRIYCFHGRHLLGEKPKYLTLPRKTPLELFPSIVSPIDNHIILVEGIFDMLNLYDKGLSNVMCCFGTDHVTEEKLIRLKMLGVTHIDIIFDTDNNNAGQKAAAKVLKLCNEVEIISQRIILSEGDPGDMTQERVHKLKKHLYE